MESCFLCNVDILLKTKKDTEKIQHCPKPFVERGREQLKDLILLACLYLSPSPTKGTSLCAQRSCSRSKHQLLEATPKPEHVTNSGQ